MLSRIRIVLVETTHPGNIGAAARAMKTMGLTRLYLVKPHRYPCAEATARASGADDVLARAQVCDSLEHALSGCRLVLGTSARTRGLSWPLSSPHEAAAKIQATPGEAALVFGREHAGLTNLEMEHCHAQVVIPANPEYSSLNLAASVQVLSYELRCAAQMDSITSATPETMPASHENMELFYTHLEQTLIDLDFYDPAKPKRLIHRLHRMFNRLQPDDAELNILRGILGAAQKAVQKTRKAP